MLAHNQIIALAMFVLFVGGGIAIHFGWKRGRKKGLDVAGCARYALIYFCYVLMALAISIYGLVKLGLYR